MEHVRTVQTPRRRQASLAGVGSNLASGGERRLNPVPESHVIRACGPAPSAPRAPVKQPEDGPSEQNVAEPQLYRGRFDPGSVSVADSLFGRSESTSSGHVTEVAAPASSWRYGPIWAVAWGGTLVVGLLVALPVVLAIRFSSGPRPPRPPVPESIAESSSVAVLETEKAVPPAELPTWPESHRSELDLNGDTWGLSLHDSGDYPSTSFPPLPVPTLPHREPPPPETQVTRDTRSDATVDQPTAIIARLEGRIEPFIRQ